MHLASNSIDVRIIIVAETNYQTYGALCGQSHCNKDFGFIMTFLNEIHYLCDNKKASLYSICSYSKTLKF